MEEEKNNLLFTQIKAKIRIIMMTQINTVIIIILINLAEDISLNKEKITIIIKIEIIKILKVKIKKMINFLCLILKKFSMRF